MPEGGSAPVSALEIGQVEVCRKLTAEAQAAIAGAAVRLTFDPGEEILAQTAASYDVYLMIAGHARVNMVASTGRQITYQILEPGGMFGELSALDGEPRSAAVFAEDHVTLARLDRAAFLGFIDTYPGFARQVMERLTKLSRWLGEKVFEYHAYDVKGRVYSELLRLDALHEGGAFTVSDRDMASRVGTTRENVTRIVGELRKQSLVEREAKQTRVLDAPSLTALLERSEFG